MGRAWRENCNAVYEKCGFGKTSSRRARKGAILDNRGTIHIDASKGYGLFLAGAIIKNYGTANITTGSGATAIKEVTATDTSKEMQDMQDEMNKVKIHSPAGAAEAKIIANGKVQTPTVVHVQAIPNRKPNDIPTSSVGMYVDTSGINYTRPITNIGALRGLTQSDLIIGVEAITGQSVCAYQLRHILIS